jgi:CheY-like chemotaxis protein
MKKILLADDSDFVRILLAGHLENVFEESEIIEAKDGQMAIEKLSEIKDFDLVISDYNMPNANGGEVFQWLIENNKSIPFLLCSVEPHEQLIEFQNTNQYQGPVNYIQKPFQFEEFQEVVQKCLSTTPKENDNEEFKKIRIPYFYRYNKALVDIFVRLSQDHFVNIIKADKKYTKKDITKYLQKGQTHLFLRSKDYDMFSDQLGSTPYLTLEPKNMSDEELRETTLSTHELMQVFLSSVGFSPSSLQYAGHNVEAILEAAERSPSLAKMIKNCAKRNDYIYDHSYLTSLVTIAISKNLDWSTRHTDEKLILATLFHDVLSSDHKIAQTMESLDQNEINSLTKIEKDKYKSELAKCLQVINQADEHFPMDVEKIVKTHHQYVLQETTNTAQITPLVAIFIVAHSYVVELYKTDFDEEKADICAQAVKDRYQGGIFEQILGAFDQCFHSFV